MALAPLWLQALKMHVFSCFNVPSVCSAVEQGTQMLEMDCHLTRDGHVVVSHDENLLRQTGHDVTTSSLNLQVGDPAGLLLVGRGHKVMLSAGFLDSSFGTKIRG